MGFTKNQWRGLLLCLALLFTAAEAGAQRLLAVTTSMSATREAARLYLHSVDFAWGGPLPGAVSPPGTAAAPILLGPDGAHTLLSTNSLDKESSDRAAWHSCCQTAPFQQSCARRESAVKRHTWAACLVPEEDSEAMVVFLGASLSDSGENAGTLEAFSWEAFTNNQPARVQWDLPGPPVACVALPPQRVAVLCRNMEDGRPVLVTGALSGDVTEYAVIDLEVQENIVDAVPAALALSRDGQWLAILITGFDLGDSAGEAMSWLQVRDAFQFRQAGEMISLLGTSRPGEAALYPGKGNLFWVATRTAGTDFAYATSVRAAQDGGVKESQYALSGVSSRFSMAVSLDNEDVAVALGNRIEIWPAGMRGDRETPADSEGFFGGIAALRWTSEGLFAAEGGRLHQLDPSTGIPECSILLQSGWITDFVLLPADTLPAPDADADGWTNAQEAAKGSNPDSPDTDADGLPDGSDPDPRAVNPTLIVPESIAFRGEAAGSELRVLHIASRHGERSAWRVVHDETSMPWLRMSPLSGRGEGYVYLGVDPALYPPGETVEGVIQVELAPENRRSIAANSPAEVSLRVVPGRGLPRRILWIWADAAKASLRDPADPRRLGALAGLLADPPLRFAHRETTGVVQDPLDSYAVVVLEAEAAVRGAVTRQAVLDYVAGGGALLFLGAYLGEEGGRTLSHWLSPVGIQINTGLRIDGRFEVAGESRLTQYWHDFLIQNGCAIGAEEGHALTPGGAEGTGAVFVARQYGLGRIALLAAPTPLESPAIQGAGERRFATELFRWLARAALEFKDMDGDGLPDEMEDANNNGQADPAETDFRNADTDEDGIPDGLEDRNRNGVVDDGETDPRNPDSDGDGIFDGADIAPCPVFGAPHVAIVEPHQGPAEGGTIAVVTGRNFTPDTTFWFGEQKVTSLKILQDTTALLRTPAALSDNGGPVTVRAVSGASQLEGVLPEGFRYTPRTVLRIEVSESGIIEEQEGHREGSLMVRFEAPENVNLGRLALIVESPLEKEFAWLSATPAGIAAQAQRSVSMRAMGSGQIMMILESGRRLRAAQGELMQIRWRQNTTDAQTPPPVRVLQAIALGPQGERFSVDLDAFQGNPLREPSTPRRQ